jgi:hypothetical protein
VTRPGPGRDIAGSEHGALTAYNCDGVRIEPVVDRRWNAVWIVPEYNPILYYYLRLHEPATGPEEGFGAFHLASTYGQAGATLDALLINAATAGGPTFDVGILNYHPLGIRVDYQLAHVAGSPYPFDFGIFPATPYTVSRVMTFDLAVQSGDLGPASLVAVTDPDAGPLHFGRLAPDFEVGTLTDLQDVATTNDSGWLVMNLDLQQIGHHGFVGWGDPAERPGSVSARVGIFHAMPDLQPVTLAGWHAPLVPRPAADAALFSCPEPDTLHGNGPFTYMNLACLNGGSADADIVSMQLRVDGDFLVGNRSSTRNRGPFPAVATP